MTIKVTVLSGVVMARTLQELLDVDVSGVGDKYLIMYDASTQKYKAVNPDVVLSSAATEPISPGLPDEFTDVLADTPTDFDSGNF